jgi:hypothetical protein
VGIAAFDARTSKDIWSDFLGRDSAQSENRVKLKYPWLLDAQDGNVPVGFSRE